MLGERFYPKTVKRHGPPSSPGVLCVAGFGDDSSMFLPLVETELAARYRLVTFDLPGFGAEPALAGRGAAAFSARFVPGEVLLASSEAHYLYNPGNCADPSMAWLSASGMSAIELHGASHWATVDAPDLVVDATLQALLPSRGSEPLR